MTTSFTCIVCGRGEFSLLTEVGRGGKPARFWICSTCGTLRQDPEFKSHWDPRAAYESGAYFQENSELPPERMWKSQRADARWRLGFLRRRGEAPPCRILEIGCSAGAFLSAARSAGFEAEGIEPDPSMAAFVRDQLKFEVFQGIWEDFPKAGPWDVICAFHVIEHVEDVNRFLRFARSRLEPGGTLFIETPDALRPWTARPAWVDWFDLGHVTGYHAASLAHVLKRGGFDSMMIDEREQLRMIAEPGEELNEQESWGDAPIRVRRAFEAFSREHAGRRRRGAMRRVLTAPFRQLMALLGR